MNLNDWATLFGLSSGIAAIVLSVLNYLRDKPHIKVTLQWDMKVTPNLVYDSNKLWGVVTVTNTGRRPIYISHAVLRLPKGAENRILILKEGIGGEKLSEGDPPRTIMVSQEAFEKYAKYWDKIYAQVSDSTGRTWRSRPWKVLGPPSWARTEGRQR